MGLNSKTFSFGTLPQNLQEMQAIPNMKMDNPFSTAALAVASFCRYGEDAQSGIDMLNYLKGPQPLSNMDLSFLRDRFRDGKKYIPFSYFQGSSPQNNYTPTQPFTITVSENPYSNAQEGYSKLFIQSTGADSPRPIQLRRKGDGTWCLWEYSSLLSGIRTPVANDPWA